MVHGEGGSEVYTLVFVDKSLVSLFSHLFVFPCHLFPHLAEKLVIEVCQKLQMTKYFFMVRCFATNDKCFFSMVCFPELVFTGYSEKFKENRKFAMQALRTCGFGTPAGEAKMQALV